MVHWICGRYISIKSKNLAYRSNKITTTDQTMHLMKDLYRRLDSSSVVGRCSHVIGMARVIKGHQFFFWNIHRTI